MEDCQPQLDHLASQQAAGSRWSCPSGAGLQASSDHGETSTAFLRPTFEKNIGGPLGALPLEPLGQPILEEKQFAAI